MNVKLWPLIVWCIMMALLVAMAARGQEAPWFKPTPGVRVLKDFPTVGIHVHGPSLYLSVWLTPAEARYLAGVLEAAAKGGETQPFTSQIGLRIEVVNVDRLIEGR